MPIITCPIEHCHYNHDKKCCSEIMELKKNYGGYGDSLGFICETFISTREVEIYNPLYNYRNVGVEITVNVTNTDKSIQSYTGKIKKFVKGRSELTLTVNGSDIIIQGFRIDSIKFHHKLYI